MQRTLLASKIHRATVTGADLHYEGSITIDRELLAAADIREYEKVQVVDVTNGARLETYAIAGDSGTVQMNGAAAHLVAVGDVIIIMSWAELEPAETVEWEPRIVLVDDRNRVVESTGRRAESERLALCSASRPTD